MCCLSVAYVTRRGVNYQPASPASARISDPCDDDDQGGNADLHIFDEEEEEEDYKEPTPLEMIGLTEEQQTAFANLSSSDLQNSARLVDTV